MQQQQPTNWQSSWRLDDHHHHQGGQSDGVEADFPLRHKVHASKCFDCVLPFSALNINIATIVFVVVVGLLISSFTAPTSL